MAWKGLALKLSHEEPFTDAAFPFKHRMRTELNRKIKDYKRGKSGKSHIFLFHNKESYESAIASREVHNLIEELNFSPLSEDQQQLGEDARAVFVKRLNSNFSKGCSMVSHFLSVKKTF